MNHFARFGLEPRPWVDSEELKQNFLRLSTGAHPDKAQPSEKASSEREFKELNQSYNVLRNTRARLLHLLELSGLPKQEHVQDVPLPALELFPVVATATRRADGLIMEKAAAASPMLKVQWMERGMEEIEALQRLQGRIGESIQQIESSVRELDGAWSVSAAGPALKQLSEAASTLGFLERWKAQLQERIGALTF
jgi:DnaJ-domain-containing protein 1